MLRCIGTTSFATAWLLAASFGLAESPASATVKLFDGQSLQGWHVVGCEAAVENGLLVVKDGDGLIRTDHRYRDFRLTWSYKPRRTEGYDAGIYFRCELPAKGKPWPDKHQVNLKHKDEGNLIGFKEGRSTGLVKPGEWNTMELQAIGETAVLKINGQQAWTVTGIKEPEGYIAIQVEVPGGGQYEFKDIVIEELDYGSLFNGTDLSDWEGAGAEAAKCWKVENGLLMCTGEKGPWLRSKSEYRDFNLRLAYKLKAGGNSGVYIRVPKDGNHHGENAGIEVQVLDDSAKQYEKLQPYQFSASLYAIAPADPRVSRPPGEWNTLEIDCRGTSYYVVHNGVRVVTADEKSHPELAKRLQAGFVGLQNHSEAVWYKDVRLHVYPAAK